MLTATRTAVTANMTIAAASGCGIRRRCALRREDRTGRVESVVVTGDLKADVRVAERVDLVRVAGDAQVGAIVGAVRQNAAP